MRRGVPLHDVSAKWNSGPPPSSTTWEHSLALLEDAFREPKHCPTTGRSPLTILAVQDSAWRWDPVLVSGSPASPYAAWGSAILMVLGSRFGRRRERR